MFASELHTKHRTPNIERPTSKAKAGAGEGNRTPVCSLGSCRSTIELHPQWNFRFSIADLRFASRENHCQEITSSEFVKFVLPPAVPCA